MGEPIIIFPPSPWGNFLDWLFRNENVSLH
jgi:hypothetical protein